MHLGRYRATLEEHSVLYDELLFRTGPVHRNWQAFNL
jgi:hypothetical protein